MFHWCSIWSCVVDDYENVSFHRRTVIVLINNSFFGKNNIIIVLTSLFPKIVKSKYECEKSNHNIFLFLQIKQI